MPIRNRLVLFGLFVRYKQALKCCVAMPSLHDAEQSANGFVCLTLTVALEKGDARRQEILDGTFSMTTTQFSRMRFDSAHTKTICKCLNMLGAILL